LGSRSYRGLRCRLRLGSRLLRPGLRLGRPVLRLYRPDLRLVGSVFRLHRSDLRLGGADFRLTRSYLRLTRMGGLNLRPIVWLRGAIDLAGAGAWVGVRDAGLRGDGPRGGNHCRTALVDVVELLTVLRGFTLVLNLGGHGRNTGATHSCNLSLLWPDGDAASAAVVGDASVVVDDDGSVVDVGDVNVDAIDGAVVVEVVAIPVAAVIPDAGVAEAVVDAAIEADVKAPEAAVEAPAVAVPAPVAGGPEGSVVGRSAPGAGDPVVTGGSPVPVAGGPDVVGGGGDGLVVDRQRGRRLVGVLNGRGLAVGVDLIISLGVLIGLVLIWRRSCLLGGGLLRAGRGSVLLGALLWWGLGADS
jgi:hypothetical protein